MKTILGSVAVILFAVLFGHGRLAAEDTQSANMRLYPGETIEWKAGPAALPPGAKMALLEGDPTKEGSFVVRFQFPDGYHVAPHTHPKTERVGDFRHSLSRGRRSARSQQREKTSGRVLRLLARWNETHGVV